MCPIRTKRQLQTLQTIHTSFPVPSLPHQRTWLLRYLAQLYSFSAFFGNLAVILVIQYSQLRKQPGYVLVTSLAAADLGVSFFVTTFKVDMYVKNGNFCHQIELCVFIHLADTFFPIASITHLLVICLNRFYAVTRSYSYHIYATYGRQKLVVAAVWCYAILWTCLGMFSWDSSPSFYYRIMVYEESRYCTGPNAYYHITLAIAIFIIPMIITTVLYSIILGIATDKASDIPTPVHIYGSTSKPKNTNTTKGVKTIASVFAAYMICWLPNFIVILIQYFAPSVIYEFFMYSPLAYDVVTTVISNVLPTVNSAINPFIYFMLSDKFKHAFRDNLKKISKRSRYSDGMSQNGMLLVRRNTLSPSSSSVGIRRPSSVTSYLWHQEVPML